MERAARAKISFIRRNKIKEQRLRVSKQRRPLTRMHGATTEIVDVILKNLSNAATRGNQLCAACLILDVRWEQVKEILPSERICCLR